MVPPALCIQTLPVFWFTRSLTSMYGWAGSAWPGAGFDTPFTVMLIDVTTVPPGPTMSSGLGPELITTSEFQWIARCLSSALPAASAWM